MTLRIGIIAFTSGLALSAAAICAEGEQDGRAQAATSALMAAKRVERLSQDQVVRHVLEERFDELEHRVRQLEDQFRKDVTFELALLKTVSMPGDREDLRGHLDAWVRAKPSYISFAARGSYYESRGFHFRGNAFVAKTPPQKLEVMKEMHDLGHQDLLRALELNPKFAPAYSSLLAIERGRGSIGSSTKIVEMAARQVPGAYYPRFEYMVTLLPRWGGSYEEMNSYVKKELVAVGINPRIWSLQGEESADRARDFLREKNYEKAIELFSAALSYGDRQDFLERRAKAYEASQKYELAANDWRRIFALDPMEETARIKAGVLFENAAKGRNRDKEDSRRDESPDQKTP